MQITGHKIIKEPVQITVDNKVLWEVVASTCFPGYPDSFVSESGKFNRYKGCNELGKPVYATRQATSQEIDVYLLVKALEKVYYDNLKGK